MLTFLLHNAPVIRTKLFLRAGAALALPLLAYSIDNGPMEGFWGILESEMYYLRKFSSEQTLTSAIEEYIHFYNTKRYQKRLRCMTPITAWTIRTAQCLCSARTMEAQFAPRRK